MIVVILKLVFVMCYSVKGLKCGYLVWFRLSVCCFGVVLLRVLLFVVSLGGMLDVGLVFCV